MIIVLIISCDSICGLVIVDVLVLNIPIIIILILTLYVTLAIH